MNAKELIEREKSKPGLRGRINAMCINCIYDDAGGAGGNWKQQIEACTAPSCPLFDVRPVSSGVKDAEDAEDERIAAERLANITPDTVFKSHEEVFKDVK